MLFSEFLREDRHVDPHVTYTVKEVKGKLDKVTAKLEANKSGVFTKLAKRYKEVHEEMLKLETEHNDMNARMKDELLEYFDAEDEVMTRVVETVSLTAQLAKQAKDSSKADDTEVIAKLLESATPELAEQIALLREQCVKITKAKSPAFTVKINESVLDSLKKAVGRFLNSIKSWTTRYDKKLEKIKGMM